MGLDRADVLLEGGQLVVDDVELLPRGVLPGRLPHAFAQLGLGVRGHRAAGVRDHQDPGDPEQVDTEDESLEGGSGDPSAGVAEDLRVSVFEPEHPERVDPRVHAGDDRDTRMGDAVEAAEVEARGELPVGRDQVVESHGES